MDLTTLDLNRPMTQEESKLLNATIFEKLSSRDPVLEKQAEDVINAFTRIRVREDGIHRRIIPPVPITNDELDRHWETDQPIKIVDREPNSPAAISMGFANHPPTLYIHADRYVVTFGRITTSRFTKDVDELRTWYMDIRQVISDNAIKDMLAEEDTNLLRTINTVLIGPGVVVPTSGTVQYEQISGGISRNAYADALKIMPNTPSSLEVKTVLMNQITVKDLMKFNFNEMGGDLSQEIVKNGWALTEFLGAQVCVTIKKGLVPTNTFYHFADPKTIGKHFSLEDITMHIKRETFMIEFSAYETYGAAIGWTSGLTRSDHN